MRRMRCVGLQHRWPRCGQYASRYARRDACPRILLWPAKALKMTRGRCRIRSRRRRSARRSVAGCSPVPALRAKLRRDCRERAVQAFHQGAMRIYATDDVIGVEVGGAVKNVLAIAAGIADGLGLGANARAALMTRGLAEMTQLGVALGARAGTLMGLSGLGDLILTATGDLSRNRTVGVQLARGQPLNAILNALGHVAEGV